MPTSPTQSRQTIDGQSWPVDSQPSLISGNAYSSIPPKTRDSFDAMFEALLKSGVNPAIPFPNRTRFEEALKKQLELASKSAELVTRSGAASERSPEQSGGEPPRA